jgi:N-acetylglutamate synthase-like GNAT family acetyltransferase
VNLIGYKSDKNKDRIINEIDHICEEPEKFLALQKVYFVDFYFCDSTVCLGTLAYIEENEILFLAAFISYTKKSLFPKVFELVKRFALKNNKEKIVLVTKRNTKTYFEKLGFKLVTVEKGVNEYVFRIKEND